MENHIYCCDRCGTIFESETDEDHCESCRALFRRSRPRTAVYLHECGVCGRKYRSKSKTPVRPLCPDCKAAALTRFMVSFFADEKHRTGFEKYLAEKRGKEGTA